MEIESSDETLIHQYTQALWIDLSELSDIWPKELIERYNQDAS